MSERLVCYYFTLLDWSEVERDSKLRLTIKRLSTWVASDASLNERLDLINHVAFSLCIDGRRMVYGPIGLLPPSDALDRLHGTLRAPLVVEPGQVLTAGRHFFLASSPASVVLCLHGTEETV